MCVCLSLPTKLMNKCAKKRISKCVHVSVCAYVLTCVKYDGVYMHVYVFV